MKKLFFIIFILLAAFLVYRFAFKKNDKTKKEAPKALAVGAHSQAFNESVNQVLDDYYAMTDGFVNWDSAAVNKSALELQTAIEDLKMDELKHDSIIYETAMFPLDNAKSSVSEILNTANWEAKRRGLHDLSENLRMLLITVKYDGGVVYWQECPMAFGQGSIGNWLSSKEQVVNPYLGNKDPKYGNTMINCGETKEKIDFINADTLK